MAKWLLIIASFLTLSTPSVAEISTTTRHLIIFSARPDEVYGSYMLGIQNSSQKPEKGAVRIMVPMETLDFRSVEGVEEKDLKLSEKGSLTIDKEFGPGMNFTGIDFLVPASFGKSELNFVVPYDIDEVSLLVPKGSGYKLEAKDLKAEGEMSLHQGQFERYTMTGLKAGQALQVFVAGVPVGRAIFWWGGWVFAGLLLAFAAFFTWRTWPS